MKVKLFLATLCMLVLPTWFSGSPVNTTATSQPFGAVAYAGHTLPGAWCECGGEGCICDPGELPNMGASAKNGTEYSSPLGTGNPSPALLMLALAFFLWSRLRA